MKIIKTIIILLLIPFLTIAQNGKTLVGGAKGKAIAGSDLNFQDIYALNSNTAGIAFIEQTSFGLYAEQRFANADIRQVGLLTAIPTKFGAFGLQLHSFGFETYNEQKICLSYARKLFDKVAIGVQFGYLNTRIPEYGNQGVLTTEIGLQAEVLENLWLGANLSNPLPVKLTETEYLPTQLNLGLTYHFSEKLQISTAVHKDFEYPASVRAGFNYRIIQPISLRLGISTQPIENSFGIGIHLKQFDLDFAVAYHQLLGFTPAFSMVYQLKKKE
jgi:hypothetical protein